MNYLFFSFFSVLLISGFANADELFRASHGGQLVRHEKSGMMYEVVRKPKEILVYPPPAAKAEVPNEITIKFKNKKGMLDHAQLKLTPQKEKTPGDNYYIAPIPAKVTVSGGVSFYFK